MRTVVAVLMACSLFTVLGWGTQYNQIDWDRIDWKKEIEKILLPPSSFPDLPDPIKKELAKRGCMIPQPSNSKKLRNVIQGEFVQPDQKDWAVLCSKDGVSTIHIFWGKATACSDKISSAKDRSYFQGMGKGTIGYSRAISAVGEKYISDHYAWYGGSKPPPLDHQGIDDGFMGKGSVVLYCHKGKWLHLTGAD